MLAILWPLSAQTPTRLLTSFESAEDLNLIQTRDARISYTEAGVTHGSRALQAEFLPAAFPSVIFRPPGSWDFSGWGELAFEVTNPGDEPITFFVRIDDDPQADGTRFSRNGSGSIPPGATLTFFFPLSDADYGMQGLPGWDGSRDLGSKGASPLRLRQIAAVWIFLRSPTLPRNLIFDHLRLRLPYPMHGIVDALGQFTGASWPGKLEWADEFATRRTEEAQALDAAPELAGRDRYGGWAEGPRLEASGFFRTEQVDGKWWLVTPEGTLFFSIGMNVIGTAQLYTFTTGREYMFAWLPEPADPLFRHRAYVRDAARGPIREGWAYCFLAANLERKYGSAYMNAWFDMTRRRLRAWGFNTVGNWSDRTMQASGIPYVTTSSISGDHNKISTGLGGTKDVPDPFDPRFSANAAASLARTAAPAKGDPWCLGHFVDNELPWATTASDSARYALALAVLRQEEARSPARAAFAARLRQKYGQISNLNSAWATDYSSWETITAPTGAFNAAMREDMGEFVHSLAARYAETVRNELKKLDPDHLYLGCRFGGWHTPEVAAGIAEFADVLSFNIYKPQIEPAVWAFLNALGKPCLISEFHFGALDRGMFHTGIMAARDQVDRGRMYQAYLLSVLEHPAFVGAHWFQYADEPLTGRTFDGENYNVGFITVTDSPYPELVEAARAVHERAYAVRYGGGDSPQPPGHGFARGVVSRPVMSAHGGPGAYRVYSWRIAGRLWTSPAAPSSPAPCTTCPCRSASGRPTAGSTRTRASSATRRASSLTTTALCLCCSTTFGATASISGTCRC
jgi:hypothetical protein